MRNIVDRVKTAFKIVTNTMGKSNWSDLWTTVQEFNMFGDTVTSPYSQVSSVYKAVKAIADNVPQAERTFFDWRTEKEIFPMDLIKLFDKPNPLMNGSDFTQALAGFYSLYEEAFIVKTLSNGNLAGTTKIPAELWTFNPRRFAEIVDHNTGRLLGWRYSGNQISGGYQTEFTVNEVVHIKGFNPCNDYRGLPPTLPIKNEIDIDWSSMIYNKSFFQNNATPDLTLSHPKKVPDKIKERIRAEWNKIHQGANKAHKMAILEGGVTANVLGSSHKDMDFVKQKSYTREEILGIWRVPKAMFNITDKINYATFQGQMKIFWLYAIQPILMKLEEAITEGIVYPVDPNIYFKFNTKNVPAYQEDFFKKVDSAKLLIEMGFPLNDVNEKLELGFNRVEWGDTHFVPFSSVPAEQAMEEIVPEPAPKDEPKDDDKKDAKDRTQNFKFWTKFLLKQDPFEKRFTVVMKSYFYGQRKRALGNLKGKAFENKTIFSINMDWVEENDLLTKSSKAYISGAVFEGVSFAESLIQARINEDILQTTLNSYIEFRTLAINRINDTNRKSINQIIQESIGDGSTIEDVSNKIRGVYNAAGNRAKVIARTEMAGAMNGGQQLYYEESGVKKKMWVSSGDAIVRDSHKPPQDGEVVRVDQKFMNGLDFPGGDGPAWEVVNCRCTIAPVIED